MERALVALTLAVAVIAVAAVLHRHHRPTARTDPGSHGWELPRAIAVDELPIPHRPDPASGLASSDRTDDRTDTGPATTRTPTWWMVAFTSATCRTCARTWEQVRALAGGGSGAGDDVIAVEVEYGTHRELHQRYGIEAVPAVAICDRDGDVARWLLGPVSSGELAGALAGARAAAGDHGASVTIRRSNDPIRPTQTDGDPT